MALTSDSHDSDPQAWHIRDETFRQTSTRPRSVDHDDGLVLPVRSGEVDECRTLEVSRDGGSGARNTISETPMALRIQNLDHREPLGYQSGQVPRQARFIEADESKPDPNVFYITSEPAMPEIHVECEAVGFDPAEFPIHWRLHCRHNLCRFLPLGNNQYWGMCRMFEDEWQGRSETDRFTLFLQQTLTEFQYDYNLPEENRVLGGHAILSVAAWPAGSPSILLDYVHVRIGGTNPTRTQVEQFIEDQLQGYDANLIIVAKYLAEHESRTRARDRHFRQFMAEAQRTSSMHYFPGRHRRHPEDHRVRFDYPDDPPRFPYVTFDWGVGTMQYNELRNRHVEGRHAWNWRENIVRGINE